MHSVDVGTPRSAVENQNPTPYHKVDSPVGGDDSAYLTAPESEEYETGHEDLDDSEDDDETEHIDLDDSKDDGQDTPLCPTSFEFRAILPCCPDGLRPDNALWVAGQSVSNRSTFIQFGTASFKFVPQWRNRKCTYWV